MDSYPPLLLPVSRSALRLSVLLTSTNHDFGRKQQQLRMLPGERGSQCTAYVYLLPGDWTLEEHSKYDWHRGTWRSSVEPKEISYHWTEYLWNRHIYCRPQFHCPGIRYVFAWTPNSWHINTVSSLVLTQLTKLIQLLSLWNMSTIALEQTTTSSTVPDEVEKKPVLDDTISEDPVRIYVNRLTPPIGTSFFHK